MVMYMCRNVKPLSNCIELLYQNMLPDQELNPLHQKQPHQVVEDGYIFCKYVCKKQSDYLKNHFYGTVLSS